MKIKSDLNRAGNILQKFLLALVMGLTAFWLWWGVNLFTSRDYSPGEPGDFFSGGVIFLIIYITFLQLLQMAKQDKENAEATVLRAYEVLKPELEGVAGQIVSKLYKIGAIDRKQTATEFAVLKLKFLDDRSVFLRELQKPAYRLAIESLTDPEQLDERVAPAIRACARYKDLMSVMVGNLAVYNESDHDVVKTITKTDAYLAYLAISGKTIV